MYSYELSCTYLSIRTITQNIEIVTQKVYHKNTTSKKLDYNLLLPCTKIFSEPNQRHSFQRTLIKLHKIFINQAFFVQV